MQYFSTNKKAPSVSFKEAVINGLAPDNGLYFPEKITPIDSKYIKQINSFGNEELAWTAIHQFVGEDIPLDVLKKIVIETVNFPFPLVEIKKNVYSLELFHGPTWAFKDVGARFMARCLGYFSEGNQQKNTVLVATSGDTGGAVADGFLGVEGVDVVILYPSGKVSDIQERQLTTLGRNITAIEVNGTFDDCQTMVKKAFLDAELKDSLRLTSANSINVARWLPQMFYYFFAYKQLKEKSSPFVFSVPSGNFGNICAGVLAQKIGLPVSHFVAATNVNDTVPRYLKTDTYAPNPTVATISNAMDVSNPSNFVRLIELIEGADMKNTLDAFSFTDKETLQVMADVKKQLRYLLDPHGAVAYLGLKKYLSKHSNYIGILLETAHPCKFSDTVEQAIGEPLLLSQAAQELLKHDKKSILMSNNFEDLKAFLLKR